MDILFQIILNVFIFEFIWNSSKIYSFSFFLSLIIFISKHIQDNEFTILWTSGVKKRKIVNLLFYISIFILIFYLMLTTLISPYFLNKSRLILSNDQFNSLLPTIRKTF